MIKKLFSILVVCVLMIGITGCSKDEDTPNENTPNTGGDTADSKIQIKTVDDFTESQGLVKYFTIDDLKFAIPETVGEFVNYLSQLGTVTLNDTGNSVDDVKLNAGGISSMMAYLTVETEDGEEQRFPLRYENDTDNTITVAEAKMTQFEVKYDGYSEFDYEKVFKGIEVITDEYTFVMNSKTNLHKFYSKLGNPERETDGRLEYSDSLGYKYTFDCCNENREGLFRGFIVQYPTTDAQ